MCVAQSLPLVCSYEEGCLDVMDGVAAEVAARGGRGGPWGNGRAGRSSSSDNEADEELDSPADTTILRPRGPRRRMRITSDKSYGRWNIFYSKVLSVTQNNILWKNIILNK